jgi:hypothetical protein
MDLEWLRKLIAELKKLRDKERKSDLYSRWLMGKRINEDRGRLEHGEKMKYLEGISKELGEGYSVLELNQRIAFARKWREWSGFWSNGFLWFIGFLVSALLGISACLTGRASFLYR